MAEASPAPSIPGGPFLAGPSSAGPSSAVPLLPSRRLPEHTPLPTAPHDPALYDGDEEEEEDPYEMYVLRRPHERSSSVVPQLVKQPEMADTRLRYRRIPAEARSGSLCSLGNHFPRRFEFPNRPSQLESLTSDEESAASLYLPSRNSSARDLSDSLLDIFPKRRSTFGPSDLAAPPPRAVSHPLTPDHPVDGAEALAQYVSVADEIAASTAHKRRKKKRAPRPPLPRSPDSFGTSSAASIVGNDLAAAIMASSKGKSGRRSPRRNSPASSPVTTPESSAKNEECNSGDSGNLSGKRAGRESPPRGRGPGSPRVTRKKSEGEQLETSSTNSEGRKSRLRRSRLSSPEIKRFHSHVTSSKNDLAPLMDERDLCRRSSAGPVYYSTRGSPAPFTEWEGRKICAPAVLGPSGAKDFLLMVEEPVVYSREPMKTKSRSKRAAEADSAGASPSSSSGLARRSKRLSSKRKRMYRSSMRLRRSLASHTRPRRGAKARERAATGAATRRSDTRRGGVERDRELSVSTHVRSTPEQSVAGPAHALRKVFQALRLAPKTSDSRGGARW